MALYFRQTDRVFHRGIGNCIDPVWTSDRDFIFMDAPLSSVLTHDPREYVEFRRDEQCASRVWKMCVTKSHYQPRNSEGRQWADVSAPSSGKSSMRDSANARPALPAETDFHSRSHDCRTRDQSCSSSCPALALETRLIKLSSAFTGEHHELGSALTSHKLRVSSLLAQ